MWMLKEGYDEVKNNYPTGGGWSLVDDVFKKDDVWKNPSFQNIIYTMYALFNGLKYEEMDYIKDAPQMASVLQAISLINISNNPGLTSSKTKHIKECYKIWKHILFKQIAIYAPSAIVFGNTFRYFEEGLTVLGAKKIETVRVENDDCFLEIYKLDESSKLGVAYKDRGPVYFFSAYHPNCRKKRKYYVNTLIDGIRKYLGDTPS